MLANLDRHRAVAGCWPPAVGEQVQRVAVGSFEFVEQALAHARCPAAWGCGSRAPGPTGRNGHPERSCWAASERTTQFGRAATEPRHLAGYPATDLTGPVPRSPSAKVAAQPRPAGALGQGMPVAPR